ncbi:uncharacterized protein EI97DRAFT_447931 [Westerdykella ornata]|uniref:Uncharacterized protein n=1 Tax=Westerdykella ornata TaxID=318751 RepID=A0A6A6JUZ5_WESOR|nr:uncharacterized protein EI97DRAFT_447931 [Westerdykella ornata]KAF2280412.1 hypothetical protein EI97DRAFT_447931 [Westerdykella ornata]
MGERKSRASPKLNKDHSSSRKMSSSSSTTPTAAIVRCPASTLRRLRHLKDREVVTLFTPVVPHPPSTTLAKDMDPFEPLGRALPGLVRHVPYRLDIGMTETHRDHLSSAGAIFVVVCATENITSRNAGALEKQARFASDLQNKVQTSSDLANVPVVVLLVTNGAARYSHEEALKAFPVLVTCEDYTPRPLQGAVHRIFGK